MANYIKLLYISFSKVCMRIHSQEWLLPHQNIGGKWQTGYETHFARLKFSTLNECWKKKNHHATPYLRFVWYESYFNRMIFRRNLYRNPSEPELVRRLRFVKNWVSYTPANSHFAGRKMDQEWRCIRIYTYILLNGGNLSLPWPYRKILQHWPPTFRLFFECLLH